MCFYNSLHFSAFFRGFGKQSYCCTECSMAVHKRCCNKILSKCEGNAESSQSTIVSNGFAKIGLQYIKNDLALFEAAKTKTPASV